MTNNKIMKILINKANPEIRITAPEIRDGKYTYMVDYISGPDSEHHTFYLWKETWTLVEEKEVDLEKEIEKAQEHYFALKDKGFSLDSMDVSVLARHFYELGRKARKEE